jgi:hypothetical protein
MSAQQTARIEKLLENKDLNGSSRSFAESLQGSCKKWGRLSDKQWSAFERMEARFSPAVIASQKAWKDDWNEEKARKLKVAAEYYLLNPPYFGDAAKTIMEEETYIPSEKLYRKMVENKYVQKVLTIMAADALYPAGSLVKVRKTARSHAYAFRDRIAMVVSTDGPIRSAAKGAKGYTILPFGESRTIEIQERWLKKAPKVK